MARRGDAERIKEQAMMSDGTRRWWALIAIAVSVLVVGLDLTVLNLALPTLARDLRASTGDLQWFASAYSLVLAEALLPAGLLGNRFGRKKVLLIALAMFGASSAACAYAGSSGALIAARAFPGLGTAAILPRAQNAQTCSPTAGAPPGYLLP
jgi:MFS family permease